MKRVFDVPRIAASAIELTFTREFRKDFPRALSFIIEKSLNEKEINTNWVRISRNESPYLVRESSSEQIFPLGIFGEDLVLNIGWRFGARKVPSVESLCSELTNHLIKQKHFYAPFFFEWKILVEIDEYKSPQHYLHAEYSRYSDEKHRFKSFLHEYRKLRLLDLRRSDCSEVQNLIEEDEEVFSFLEEFYDYFGLYLEGKATPYFFFYDPKMRSFSYRGVIAGNESQHWWTNYSELDEREIRETANKEFLRYFHRDILNLEFKYLYLLESLRQYTWQGLNSIIYNSGDAVWTSTATVDTAKKNPEYNYFAHDIDSVPNLLKDYEFKVLRCTTAGKDEVVNLLFEPVKCFSQVRGNLIFKTINENARKKLLRTHRYIAGAFGEKIERYFSDQFRSNVNKETISESSNAAPDGIGFVNAVLKHMPDLLNTDIAGYMPIRKDAQDGLTCLSTEQFSGIRRCRAYGFTKDGKVSRGHNWIQIGDQMAPCLINDKKTRNRCFLKVLRDNCENLLSEQKKTSGSGHLFITFPIAIPQLKKGIYEHFNVKMHLPNPSTGPRSENTTLKTMACWLLEDEYETGKKYHFFWAAVDMSPAQFDNERHNMETKFLEVERFQKRYFAAAASITDKLFKEQIRTQEHNIFNLMPNQLVETAEMQLESGMISEAMVNINDSRKLLSLLNVCFCAALTEKGNIREAEELENVDSLTKMISFLESTLLSTDISSEITYDHSFRNVSISAKDKYAVFTILWNLWHNAKKIYYADSTLKPTNFYVKGFSNNFITYICFKNPGKLEKVFSDYLIKGVNYPGYKTNKSKKGLEIIRDNLKYLNWRVESVNTSREFTSITISIPNPNKESNDE